MMAKFSSPSFLLKVRILLMYIRMVMKQDRSIAGFTLIELSIVIIIMGLLSTVFLASLKTSMMGRERKVTLENLESAQLALKSYLAMNDAYPCPASRNALKDSKEYGRSISQCMPEQASLVTTLTGRDITAAVAGRDRRMVRIGVLPFRSLSLSDAKAVDGWGNLLQYAVTESLTDPLLFDQNKGAIDVVAEDGQSRIVPSGSVQYVIFSTGRDGGGGITASGKMSKRQCPLDMLQTENCDDDAVFMDSEARYEALGKGTKEYAAVYDDHIAYLQYDPDRKTAGGVLFYYRDSCPQGFMRVPLDDNASVPGVKTLRLEPPEDHRGSRDNSGAKNNLCYSSKYEVIMPILTEETKEPQACPQGWDAIGFGVTRDEDDGFYYQYCAR
jgi:prepilin-type N-terminal cleavage/methylation domain-containing protein